MEWPAKSCCCSKADVEGHEMSVLKGAERTIPGNVPFILVEYGDKMR